MSGLFLFLQQMFSFPLTRVCIFFTAFIFAVKSFENFFELLNLRYNNDGK